MRVSNRQMVNIVKSDLFRNAEQLLKAEERVATRKLINRPSDDPIGMGKVLDYRKTISSIDQYNRNIGTAKSRIEFTDTLLEDLHDLLGQAKQIAVEHSNELDPALRESAAQQVEGIYDQVFAIANTKYGDAYLFAGHDTDTIPFPRDEVTTGAASTLSGGEHFTISSPTTDYYVWYDIDNDSTDPDIAGRIGIEVNISSVDTAAAVASATQTAINDNAGFSATVINSAVTITSDGEGVDVSDYNSGFSFQNATYNGDSGKINIIVGEGAQVRINLTGDEVFTGVGVASGTNVFDDLKALKVALEAVPFDPSAVSSLTDNLAKGVNQVESAAVRQSITYKRLETTENHWDKFKNSIVDMLSKIEDADLASAIVELQAQETAYEASLAAAATMLDKNSLIDFLR
ncbi:MAG: flagellar hook-associated protein FlgL [Desulfobacteraceae bacterium]|nr:flagellar hook-associated protein FlgL [Desulfobacteraceae bacterium]